MNERSEEAWRDVYAAMRHAFGHDVSGGHHHLNIEQFMRALERYVTARIEDALMQQSLKRGPRNGAAK